MKISLLFAALLTLNVAACSKEADKAGTGTSAAPATAEPACDAVVAKMMSFQPGSGEAEKKFLTAACPSMPPAMKTCIVAAKTKADYDACSKAAGNQKLVK